MVHTLDLPDANKTTDNQINDLSEREQRIVVTKDADFVSSFLLSGRPYKLLLIATGNITNRELEAIVMPQLSSIVEAFKQHHFLELNRTSLVIHG